MQSHPPIMWAQDKNKVYVTLKLQDVQNEDIQFLSNAIKFRGSTLNPHADYDYTLELFQEIAEEDKETKYTKLGRYLQINLRKRNTKIWWPRLAKTTQKLHNVKIDWEKWIDDDEADADDLSGDELPNTADKDFTSSSDSDDENEGDKKSESKVEELKEVQKVEEVNEEKISQEEADAEQ